MSTDNDAAAQAALEKAAEEMRSMFPKEQTSLPVYGKFYQSAESFGSLYRIIHTGKWVTACAGHLPGMGSPEDGGGMQWNGTSSVVIQGRDGNVATRSGDWLSWQERDSGNTYEFEAVADEDHDGYYFLKLDGKWVCMNKDCELNVKGSGWYVVVGGPQE